MSRAFIDKRKLAYNESKVSRMSQAERFERITELITTYQFDTINRDWMLLEILKLSCHDADEFASTCTGLGNPVKIQRRD